MTQEMDTQITLTIVRPYIAKSASHDSRNENDTNEMNVDPTGWTAAGGVSLNPTHIECRVRRRMDVR